METHFRYEEKKLAGVLNAMDLPDWRARRPDFLLARDGGGEDRDR